MPIIVLDIDTTGNYPDIEKILGQFAQTLCSMCPFVKKTCSGISPETGQAIFDNTIVSYPDLIANAVCGQRVEEFIKNNPLN